MNTVVEALLLSYYSYIAIISYIALLNIHIQKLLITVA